MSALPEFNLFGEAVPPPPPPKPSLQLVYQAYAQSGGRLDKTARNVLGQQARKLMKEGHALERVAKAAGQLGRTNGFPAFLGRTVREMPEPCVNGAARARLTQAQLAGCACESCAEWHQLRQERPLTI